MMRLALKAALLVVFYVLTSAATVYAECAWVLWMERDRDSDACTKSASACDAQGVGPKRGLQPLRQ
jgi:hypothetical protein